MKRMTAILTFATLAWLLNGCTPSPVDSEPTTPFLRGTTYRNPTVGFEITAPREWTIQMPSDSGPNGTSPLVDMWQAQKGLAASVLASYNGATGELDCSEIRTSVVQGIPGSWSVSIEPARMVLLDEKRACGVRFTGGESGATDTITIDQVFVLHRSYTVLLTFKSPGTDTVQPEFAEISNSVQLY